MLQNSLDEMERNLGPNAVITVELTHEYMPDVPLAEDDAPSVEQLVTIHTFVYEDGTREECVLNGEGRYEWLHGIVYRDAAAPERVYREVWYPTGVFRDAKDDSDAET